MMRISSFGAYPCWRANLISSRARAVTAPLSGVAATVIPRPGAGGNRDPEIGRGRQP
jgi:hypothetical protein